MAYVFILQNISANLGGMLTPFGNPQNLYLYSSFEIPTGEFMSIMLWPFLLAIAMLTGACFLLKPAPLSIEETVEHRLEPKRTALYLVLFAYSILIVFRVVPYWTGLALIPVVLLFADRRALLEVDYGLLLTFTFFFIFSGNMARIDVVSRLLEGLLSKSTLLVSEASCQVISNVPAAILLSGFTDHARELLLGVDIGGLGTPVASLASLISLKLYSHAEDASVRRFMGKFLLVNFALLAVLLPVASLL